MLFPLHTQPGKMCACKTESPAPAPSSLETWIPDGFLVVEKESSASHVIVSLANVALRTKHAGFNAEGEITRSLK